MLAIRATTGRYTVQYKFSILKSNWFCTDSEVETVSHVLLKFPLYTIMFNLPIVNNSNSHCDQGTITLLPDDHSY